MRSVSNNTRFLINGVEQNDTSQQLRLEFDAREGNIKTPWMCALLGIYVRKSRARSIDSEWPKHGVDI
jgi:hypothetical protein